MKFLLTLVYSFFALSIMAADEVKLPVLRVNFDGEFVKDMDYVDGRMELTDENNQMVSFNAKFKIRGATSLSYTMKPSFNMKLRDETYESSVDASLLGMPAISSWILDAMAIDRINMRNRTLFDIWNEFSKLPYETDYESRNGTTGKFLEVYINDIYKGIYVLSDKISRKLLNLDKYDKKKALVKGVLYKSGTTDIDDQNTEGYFNNYTVAVVEWHNAWEMQEPEDYECEEAWAPLFEAIKTGKSYDYVKKHFFIDNLIDYQLFTMAFNISDNWGNKNHFFSIRNIQQSIDDADPTVADQRRFVLTPWDLDTSLGGRYDGSSYTGGNAYTFDPAPADMVKNGGFYPFHLCQGQTEYKIRLKERWLQLRSTSLSVNHIAEKINANRDLFLNSGAWERQKKHWDAEKYRPCYVENLTTETDAIIDWYQQRHDDMDTYFGIDTAIDDASYAPMRSNKPRKLLRHNRIVIEKNGNAYSISGVGLGE